MTLSSFSPLQDSLLSYADLGKNQSYVSGIYVQVLASSKCEQFTLHFTFYVLNCVTVKCYVPLWCVFF